MEERQLAVRERADRACLLFRVSLLDGCNHRFLIEWISICVGLTFGLRGYVKCNKCSHTEARIRSLLISTDAPASPSWPLQPRACPPWALSWSSLPHPQPAPCRTRSLASAAAAREDCSRSTWRFPLDPRNAKRHRSLWSKTNKYITASILLLLVVVPMYPQR